MSAQPPPSAVGDSGAAAAASGDAVGDAADGKLAPVYDEAQHREAFEAKVKQRFADSKLVEKQSLTLQEVEALIFVVDGWEKKTSSSGFRRRSSPLRSLG